jgi:hypothetical protein
MTILVGFGAALALVSLALAGLTLVVPLYTPTNIGSISRFGDSATFRAIRRLIRVGMKPCGCLYERGWRSNAPGHETVETDRFWQRAVVGAKVEYRDVREELRRCEFCGGFYHHENRRYKGDKEFWRDDPEPYPDDDREIREADS